MSKVTAVLISFLRPGYTKACIESLRREYGRIGIIVADNAGDQPEMRGFCEANDVEYYPMPYDSGVCQARNFLMSKVRTDYVLVGDDDFFYDDNAKVRQMVMFMDDHSEFDLIGGLVSQNDIVHNYQGTFERFADHIQMTAIKTEDAKDIDERSGLHFCPAELTFNYFVGRTERIKAVPWDENIKVAYEHFTWFSDFKDAGGHVAFSPDPVVIHKPRWIDPQQSAEYADFRNRKTDREYFFQRFNIDYTLQMNGQKDLSPFFVERKKGNDTKYVDFLITTFKRPKALERLLLSITRMYPMANVYVADQNEKFDRAFYRDLRTKLVHAGLIKRLAVFELPYDCGLSYARNYLMENTPNAYKLILDDDFVFTKQTDIGKMVKLLESHNHVGVVGGAVEQTGQMINFEFNLEIKDGTLTHVSDGNVWRVKDGIKYRKTGCVLNFALFRREVFHYIKWDNELKVMEHSDFYLRMKDVPYAILYTPEVIVDHPPTEREADYKALRQRQEFMIKIFKKHKVKRMKYLNGQVVELMPDGIGLKRYKEL